MEILEKITVAIKLAGAKSPEKVGVHYVQGIISSDGEDKIKDNLENLRRQTEDVRREYPEALVFSATDIFTPEISTRLTEMRLPSGEREALIRDFWDNVFEAVHVTHLHITPGSERSEGARRERVKLKDLGATFHYRI